MDEKRPLSEGSKSGGPGSNRQPLAWKAKALPLSYRREQVQLYKNMGVFKGVIQKDVAFFCKKTIFTATITIYLEVA